MLRLLLPLFACACAAPAVRPPTPPVVLAAARAELWVDASAVADGDGTAERPFRSLASALERLGDSPATLRVRTGLYEGGPLVLRPAQALEGTGQVVLTHSGAGPVVWLAPGATLRGVTVQGGDVGVAAGGEPPSVLPPSPPPPVSPSVGPQARSRGAPVTPPPFTPSVGPQARSRGAAPSSPPAGSASLRSESAPIASALPRGETGSPERGATPGRRASGPTLGEAGGAAFLEAVSFSGQRDAAVSLAGGRLELSGCQLSATLARARGVVASGDASLVLRDSQLLGAYAQGVQFESSGELLAERVRFEGPVTGLRVVSGKAMLRSLAFAGGRGPALLIGGAEVEVRDVSVLGHEYGLLARGPASLRVVGFTSVRADRAGIAIVGGRAELEELVLLESGDFGAVQLVNVGAKVERFLIQGPRGYGLNIREGKVAVALGEILRVVDEGSTGDGIHARHAQVDVQSVSVLGAGGVGVMAAEAADVTLRDVRVEQAAWGAVLAETLGKVRVSSLTSVATPAALVVPDEGRIDADVVDASGVREAPIWAECARGAHVRASRLRSTPIPPKPTACVELVAPLK